MTKFVPTAEEISDHLALVSPEYRAFVEGGQAALDAEAAASAPAPSEQAVADAQAVLDASEAAQAAPAAPAPVDPSATVAP